MNPLRICTVASILFLLVLGLGPGALPAANAATAAVADSRLLTGELVVTNARRNQFRLVGHSGLFTAPGRISVDALDGVPARVVLGSDGRVLQIIEIPIHIDPIEHQFERIQGQLMVSDARTGTFMLAGDNRIYVAPAGIDLSQYTNRFVELHLNEEGRVVDVAFARGPSGLSAASACWYTGQNYPDGTSLCQFRTQYRCERGEWRNLGTACQSGDAVAYRSRRTCTFANATVTDGSAICRDGWTFRCADGEWVNIWTVCR